MIRPRQLRVLCIASLGLAAPTHAETVADLVHRSEVAATSERTVERRPFLMGIVTRIEVTAPTHQEALETISQIEQVLRTAEGELSTWSAGTELARFNRAEINRPIKLSPTLDSELSRAFACADATDGAFNPTVGALSQAWDLRGDGRAPEVDELQDALDRSRRGQISRDAGTWTRHRDVLIDEGGFGKGAALDRVRQALKDLPSRRVLVDLGGQFLFFDSTDKATPWPLAVADPDDRSRPVLYLDLLVGSVATSANSERSVEAEGTAIGHLLDPRTGQPARDFGSITVWTATALEADCLATGLFVAGPEAALEFAARHPDIEVLVIERNGSRLIAHASDGLRDRVEMISDRITLAQQSS